MPERLPAFKIATHEKPAPFACDGVLRLAIELNPFLGLAKEVVTERCLECGEILHAQPVAPEPELTR